MGNVTLKPAVILAAAVLALAPAGLRSEPESGRPMTFEDMMAMRRLGDTAVSPDGRWVAYSVSTVDLERNTVTPGLLLQPVAGGEPRPVAGTAPGDSGIQFAADGRQILFLSGRSGAAEIWLADFDPATGETTRPRRLTSLNIGVDNARWSPDGHFIVFTAAVYPDCPPIASGDGGAGARCTSERDARIEDSKVKAQIFTHLLYRHWNRYTGDRRSHLFEVEVPGGGVRDLTPGDPHDVPPFSLEGGGGFDISPDGRELAFTRNPDPEPALSTSARIYTLDLTHLEARPVQISVSQGGNFTPAYSPDGRYLAWRSQERAGYESDRFRLVVYDRTARSVRDLLPGFDQWVEEFQWARDSGRIFFTSGTRGTVPIYSVQADGRGLARLSTPGERGAFGGLHPLAGDRLLASRMTVEAPPEIVAVALSGAKAEGGLTSIPAGIEQITHLNDRLLAGLDLSPMESFWFTAADGARVEGFLVRPPGFDPRRRYPVKFLIHGGPQGAWDDSWSFRWNPALFAAGGYVVVMINPRGSVGYGQAFIDGVNQDWGGKPFTDLMTGLDYAEGHYPFLDRGRECALGASFGGYMANWILGHTDRFRCIVSHDGMYNAESAYGSTEELWFNEWEFKGAPWDHYGRPDSENPFRRWSPSLSAKNFRTPTLVVHSQLDYRLDVSEGFQLFTALQRLGVPSKMLYFPDEGHWVLKPQNSRLWYRTVNEWVDQWTSGASPRNHSGE